MENKIKINGERSRGGGGGVVLGGEVWRIQWFALTT
jgi:hypothetical protein